MSLETTSKTPCLFFGGTKFQTKLADGLTWHKCEKYKPTSAVEACFNLSRVWKEGVNWEMKQQALNAICRITAEELGKEFPEANTNDIIIKKAREIKNV